jgi:PAS domain S-box-containing protein
MFDVTERVQYETRLRSKEEHLRAIMDNASESIIVINEQGIITDFNPASENLFGYHTDEIIGHNVSILMPSPYREQHNSYIANYLKTGKSLFGKTNKRQLPGRRKDGTIIPLELTVDRINHLGLFCGMIRDMSENKTLEKQVADIVTREQDRIGQDIHDGLGQQLTGLNMMLSSLKRELLREKIPQASKLDEIISYLQKAAEDSRTLSRGLAPMSIETLGLEDAVKLLARDTIKITGINCTVEIPEPVNINDNTITIQIYRLIQEAVNNAVKHANAKNIAIKMNNTDQFEISVTDDGTGFDMDEEQLMECLGIRIMRYRAGIIGCNLHISTSPAGTCVNCKHIYGTI